MDLDLQSKNIVLSTLPDFVDGYVVDEQPRPTTSTNDLASLWQVLKTIVKLPKEALFLGIAEDDRPLVLNLWDPKPGPILVAGDSHAGKTGLLQTVSHFAVATHDACEIQYGVITNRPDQWVEDATYPHCMGIFSAWQNDVTRFIRALSVWIELHHTPRQSVLLLIDGLDDFLSWNAGLMYDLQKILSLGSEKRIWTFATVNLENIQNAEHWLEYFDTRVFGYTTHIGAMDHNCPYSGLDNLSRGREFYWKEKQRWLKFRTPGI